MKPRPVFPGKTYLFTRRCSERRFFLRPGAETNNTFWYCLGWAAQKHGIVLHAAVAMSNHLHIVATDTFGVYPLFLRDFHGLLARSMNALLGRWEHFWDANQTSAVLLEGEAAQLDKLAYTLSNPAEIIERAAEWPGATAIAHIVNNTRVEATIPRHFFRADKKGASMPARVAIEFEPPPMLLHWSSRDYLSVLRDRVRQREKDAQQDRRERGVVALTPKQVLAQRWDAKPSTPEIRRGLSPTVACRDKWLRIERLQERGVFHNEHEIAFHDFRRGLKAVFPPGTWMMRFRAAISIGATESQQD